MRRKEFAKLIIFFLLPIIFQFFGQANITNTILIRFNLTDDNIKLCKDILFIFGIVFTMIPLGAAYCKYINSVYVLTQQQEFLIYKIKEYLLAATTGLTGNNNINIRLFTPKTGFCDIIYMVIRGLGFKVDNQKEFVMRNIKGFTDNNIKDGLIFQVYPNPEGLVGKCYSVKSPAFDYDLKNSPVEYNLSNYQKLQTQDTAFCICIPLFDSQNNIYAIMSFDSNSVIRLSDKKKDRLFSVLVSFSTKFGENMPSLFK